MRLLHISVQNKKYLSVREPCLRRFYLLPNIHKRLKSVPAGPAISNCGTVTKRKSELMDFPIQLLIKKMVPSVLKDTSDFLHKL